MRFTTFLEVWSSSWIRIMQKPILFCFFKADTCSSYQVYWGLILWQKGPEICKLNQQDMILMYSETWEPDICVLKKKTNKIILKLKNQIMGMYHSEPAKLAVVTTALHTPETPKQPLFTLYVKWALMLTQVMSGESSSPCLLTDTQILMEALPSRTFLVAQAWTRQS